ncbi:MAG: Uma2 family endonuclease [Tepidiformaceae bacterium]
MAVSPATYEQLALEDDDTKWELVCGQLRAKPPMTHAHNSVARWLQFQLQAQLPFERFEVSQDSTRVLLPNGTYYVPDVVVIPHHLVAARIPDRQLEAYREPLPLIVEVWSRTTGSYDVETKLADYQARGDLEIWRIHPYEKTLTTWVRQPDGNYAERLYSDGFVRCPALPGVRIDLDALFALIDG